ncbi:hypothetical protein FIBSPDRAFT_884541 [Athelia psychrophila]|uniref:Uncharacterized protein n=1 Tax=Athelia psychrophila TaxID=1759441 RepID=A0A166SV09_9AGAM|nr:hypothetical protein FIBSPDRAFT_884541 [Fibularhizoctonia sp. CBS 109695]
MAPIHCASYTYAIDAQGGIIRDGISEDAEAAADVGNLVVAGSGADLGRGRRVKKESKRLHVKQRMQHASENHFARPGDLHDPWKDCMAPIHCASYTYAIDAQGGIIRDGISEDAEAAADVGNLVVAGSGADLGRGHRVKKESKSSFLSVMRDEAPQVLSRSVHGHL